MTWPDGTQIPADAEILARLAAYGRKETSRDNWATDWPVNGNGNGHQPASNSNGHQAQPAADDIADRILPGGCILDQPRTPEPVWGDEDEILWARGQSLIIAGPDGVGKTTLAGQSDPRAATGSAKDGVLGLPVRPGNRNVLVLLMDRPQQAMTALARLFTEDRPGSSRRAGCGSGAARRRKTSRGTRRCSPACARSRTPTRASSTRSKTPRCSSTDDETGSGWNRARQAAIESGTEIIELHHPRKGQEGNRKPAKLEDLYGSRWIPAGAGSVICAVG